MAYIYEFPVGSEAIWLLDVDRHIKVRIDSHDHNGEICWITMLDGEFPGSQGPVSFDRLEKIT